jgi:hypothetical protein
VIFVCLLSYSPSVLCRYPLVDLLKYWLEPHVERRGSVVLRHLYSLAISPPLSKGRHTTLVFTMAVTSEKPKSGNAIVRGFRKTHQFLGFTKGYAFSFCKTPTMIMISFAASLTEH